jgi:cation transport regulator ChaB
MYRTIQELPPEVQGALPTEVCEFYVAVYNRLYEKASAGSTGDEAETARTAHEGAVLAVQTEFEADESGRWRRAPIGEAMDKIGRADPVRIGKANDEPAVHGREE